ncbi:hypothetical protein [Shewanella sp. UCD-KL21]|uniref:hypothetical protein n=1 Tax=Shewanella sp. UCD-KL21 TaxID=1917164 RepID=UPI0011155E77|nr:hypothetical protein [Shewanella sp. UCD-KL21]
MAQEPKSMFVNSHLAANGVEDDASLIFKYEQVTATLGTSFRCKLPNWAYIIGDGYIAIPDFWRASECHLYQLDEKVAQFDDKRKTIGFNYEIEAVAADILEGKLGSSTVTSANSLIFQKYIEAIRAKIYA